MRIAIVNSNRTLIGGIETYLRGIMPALAMQDHDVAFWHEEAETPGREAIPLPEGTLSWSVAALGPKRALDALRQWQPDIIYAHGLRSPELEAKILKLAPAVFFAHAYYGSCISGEKSFKFPASQPCDRRFGWQCLVHYYPNRCGGLNPLTMLREYGLQKQRLSLLSEYAAIIVASSHMCREYRKYGLLGDGPVASTPFTPSFNQSGMPPTAKATVGTPCKPASKPTKPNGSGHRLGTTIRSQALNISLRRFSSSHPVNVISRLE